MARYGASFVIGFVAGLRSMTACAALSQAAARGQARLTWIPGGGATRGLLTAAALAEMAGDKMPFAPDRRILPSFLARLAIGAAGGAALAGRDASLPAGGLAGIAGAATGTLLGRAARGGVTGSGANWGRALAEDAVAAGLAAALLGRVGRHGDALARPVS
ncbi:hypothetical protein F1189_08810 [Rhodovastum atsumiense]|uniref:DUF4126 domain-containing protein n=2 Tax=Rhodovastum atsumiense TaxID=504468 RepID=A0A5M6IWN4_9PROT|nr:hypothetical protein F1189_08810 [Rhodovastum atsumiense]